METAKVIDRQPTMTDSATGHDMTIYDDMEHIAGSLHSVMNNIITMSEKKEEVKSDKATSEEVQRLLKKYGATRIVESDMRRLHFVTEVDKNMGVCKKCKGAPCKRSDFNFYYNKVTNIEVIEGELQLRGSTCEYQKAFAVRQKLEEGWHGVKMPKFYYSKTFSDYEVTADNAAAVKAAKEFLTSGTGGLFFYGNPGTGKTFLAAIVAQEFMKSDKSMIFGEVPTLLETLRSSFDDKNTNIADLMKSLLTVDLLVLDDFGTERPTTWAVERIFSIVNQRYNAEKPMIITSNYRMKEIGERMNHPKDDDGKFLSVTGDRIVSRLAGMCQRVEFKGKDRRF